MRKCAFVVTFWVEPERAGGKLEERWRGRVEQIGAERRLYFNEFASLVAFLTAPLGRRAKE